MILTRPWALNRLWAYSIIGLYPYNIVAAQWPMISCEVPHRKSPNPGKWGCWNIQLLDKSRVACGQSIWWYGVLLSEIHIFLYRAFFWQQAQTVTLRPWGQILQIFWLNTLAAFSHRPDCHQDGKEGHSMVRKNQSTTLEAQIHRPAGFQTWGVMWKTQRNKL